MKKFRLVAALLAAAVLFTAGCGGNVDEPAVSEQKEKKIASDKDEDADGADWRTWASYKILEWHGPDGSCEYYLDISTDGGLVRVIEDKDEYTVVSDCVFSADGVKDFDTVDNSIAFEDADGDGYDDLSVTDMDGGHLINSIFLYDPASGQFVYSEEYSGFVAGQWGNNALTYDTWQEAYKVEVELWEDEHSNDYVYGYKLFYLDDDDIPELALVGSEEFASCKLYRFVDNIAFCFYETDNLGVDGRGLCYYEKSGVISLSSWVSGIGDYVFYMPVSDEPYKEYLSYRICTEGNGMDADVETSINFIEPSGDSYDNVHQGEEYDLADLPERADIEAALGIADLSDIKRIDNEDDLMSFDDIMEILDLH